MAEKKMNDQNEARELMTFQLFYNKREMKTTWALAAVIAIMFLLEEIFGGSTTTSVLVRMGANVRELVAEGQYFRLLTSVFLHAGWLHVFVNIYVLFALGGFFNRILGESKYLTVFLLSGITGSLSSNFLGASKVSVGASGAIWGLFGASIVIAFFKTRLIPETVRIRLRRVTLINLVLNLGISFLPMVDFWAHIGGGVGGFLCSLFFIAESDELSFSRVKTRIFQIAAILLTLLYAAGFTQMFLQDKPWIKRAQSPLVNVEFAEVPFVVALPRDLSQTKSPDNNSNKANYLFGDLRYEPIAIDISFIHAPSLKEKGETWLKEQRDLFFSDPKVSAETRRSIDLRREGDTQVLFFEVPGGPDIMTFNYVMLKENYIIKIAFIASKSTKQIDIEKLAKKIIPSIQVKS